MKYILTILLFLSTYLSNSQIVYELCKGDSVITLYTDYKPNYLVNWFISPNVQILSQDNNEIVIFTNNEGVYNISAYYSNQYCKSDFGYYKIKIVNCLDSYIWFPNAFSPNHDGINDLFIIKFMYITDYYLEIYNRWGELLFADKTYIWDGYYKDYIVSDGIYTYKFTYKENNKQKQHIGKLTLIK